MRKSDFYLFSVVNKGTLKNFKNLMTSSRLRQENNVLVSVQIPSHKLQSTRIFFDSPDMSTHYLLACISNLGSVVLNLQNCDFDGVICKP